MTIYSVNLGRWSGVDTGVDHLLYTVPSGGTAVIKSTTFRADPNTRPVLYIEWPGGFFTWFAFLDNAGGAATKFQGSDLYLPLPPLTKIHATNLGAAGAWDCSVGGYQFAT